MNSNLHYNGTPVGKVGYPDRVGFRYPQVVAVGTSPFADY